MEKKGGADSQQVRTDRTPSAPVYGIESFGSVSMTIDEFSEIIPSGFAIFSVEENRKIRSLYVNSRGSEIFGETAQDYKENYQGRILSEWPFSLEDDIITQNDMLDLIQGKTIEFTVPAKRVDGRGIWLRAFCKMQAGDKAQTFFATFFDVSDQILSEEREKWQNERYRLLVQTIGGCVYDYDVERGRYTYTNRNAAGKLVSRTRPMSISEVIQSDSRICNESRAGLLRAAERALSTPCEGSYEYQAVLNGKNPRWFAGRYISVTNEKGRVFRIVGVFKDMQEQKDRENRKIAQERSFRLSMNADAILSLDFNAVTGERIVLPGDVCPQGIPENVTLSGLFGIFVMLVHPDDLDAALQFREIDHVVSMCEESSGTVRREMRIQSLTAPDDDYRWAMIRILHTKDLKKGAVTLVNFY